MDDHAHHEGFLTSADGLRIYHQCWLPPGEPRAAIAIVHGLGEHSGRYAHLAARLVDAGYAVHALDHRGHGRSDGRRVYAKRYQPFIDDIDLFRRHVADTHPGRPVVLLGHSMGGNLAVGYALDHPGALAALVLSGPALKIGDEFSALQLRIFDLLGRLLPWLRVQALDADAISRDPQVVAAYRSDPLVYTGKVTAGLGRAVMGAMRRFPARYHELTLPILLLHGTEDRLASIAGTRELAATASNAGVTSHYYDGLYHEVFNEPEQDRVVGDLLAWLAATL